VEEHRKHDPLLSLKQTILGHNLGTEADFKQLERDISNVVMAAVKFAEESPFPAPSVLHDDVLVKE
jgi:pyruvate dehydrogenase E1 component alpha subunit